MKSRSKAKRSIVPFKFQIALAVLLGIAFIVLLTARLKGRGNTEGASPPAEGRASIDETLSAGTGQRIELLINEISSSETASHGQDLRAAPQLSSDPFIEPDKKARSSARDGLARLSRALDPRQRAEEHGSDAYARQSREEFIANLTLQATLIDGNVRFALIDGKLFAENDHVGRFKIARIGERVVLLSDDIGSILLKMKGDDRS